MCKILMSINPQYVEKILNGKKKYEFRKHASKRIPDKIIIYCTSPVKKIVGEVEVIDVLQDTPAKIWKKTYSKSGISKKFYNIYYQKTNRAVAYKLGLYKKYKKEKELCDYNLKFAPQSFLYLD